jgi:hypothetical protein
MSQQTLFPFVGMCGRYPSVCPLTAPSSCPGTSWCARCDCIAPTAIRSS